MSIQPVSSSSFAAEPAVQRRPAPERDDGNERESFVLPREERAPETATSSRETRQETASDTAEMRRDAGEARRNAGEARRDAGEARRDGEEARRAAGEVRRASDEPTMAPEKPSDAPARTAAPPAAAETSKPVGKAAEAVPAGQPTVPNLDIAALVSIAAAAQAGKTGEAKSEKSEGELAEGEAGSVAGAATEPKAEGVAVVVPTGIVPAPPVPVLTLPTDLAGAQAAGSAGEGDLLSGKAGPATAAALSLVAAREAKVAAASGADEAAVATAGTAAASPNGSSGSAETTPLSAGDGPVAKPEGGQDGSDKVAQTQSPAVVQASLLSEFKPIDALQQAVNPIDLTALGQGGGRPEPLRILTMPEQVAAQASAATQGQSAASGPPTPLHVLPIEIGLRALAGARQFDIRLDPGELGRVDVNLSISDNGEVTARMVVDRVETLHLLQRDARTLERAFEQAGLKPSEGGVDITLRDPSDQSGFRQRQQDEAPQRPRSLTRSELGEDGPVSAQPAPAGRFVRLGGVDLSI